MNKPAACLYCFLLSLLVNKTPTDAASLPTKGLGGVEVACSIQDSEGYWWFGGKGTGLCRYDGYETEAFLSDRQRPHLLRSNDVLCIAEQRTNAEIWFGTKEGAYILSKKDYTVRPVSMSQNELADKRVACMMAAADGSMWLTYRNQVLHFSSEGKLIERFETTWEGKNRSVLSFCFDADSVLWLGLWNGGVVRLKKENKLWKMENHTWDDYPLSPQVAFSMEQQRTMLDSVMNEKAPSTDAKVLSLVVRSDHSIFVGTYHSLFLYDGQSVRRLLTGLDKVRSMAYSDKTQSLYLLSKARGVCLWKDEKLTTILDSTQFRQLQLQGDTALLLSKGVGDTRLLDLRSLVLSTDTINENVHPIATAYILNGEKRLIQLGQQVLSLPRGIDFVEVCLSTFDYDHAKQVQFAYRMDGADEWTLMPEGEHVVRLSHLPSGESQLQVRATDAYGRWSNPTMVLTFMRPTVWYEDTWLWVFLGVVLLVGGFYLMKKKNKQKAQQAQHSQEPAVEEELNRLPVADQEFLDKAVAAVSAHMIDTDYNVDALASDLCMSRANLHRKMRAITGQTPTDFIRNQRLERAAHLLRTTSHSVNEISNLVGFSYASYFTKCFKEKYGVLPKDYVK